jgi:hypothetical protein
MTMLDGAPPPANAAIARAILAPPRVDGSIGVTKSSS